MQIQRAGVPWMCSGCCRNLINAMKRFVSAALLCDRSVWTGRLQCQSSSPSMSFFPRHSLCAFVCHLCPSSKHATLTLCFRLSFISDARNKMYCICALYLSYRVLLQNVCLLCAKKEIEKREMMQN